MKNEAKKLFRFLRTKPVPTNTNEILALERTKLANERTLLSYIRSSLYLLIGGIGILQLKDFESIKWLGYVALGVCVIFLAVGIIRYMLLMRRLYKWNRILFVDTIPEPVEKKPQPKDSRVEAEAK
ncbi:DUF202 domain-containing protein [Aequorivita sp. KMM 9714]|uniref:DUF202 domain-containing protein n=1 Tax=Aequorivita sp. KMM 9714 TaxID=2707173 RepID=UPI0013EDBEF5|nr:DUF202 domain-containing protein [Aequorivita sp. KMM 9714]NGX85231.1 DUF202 domain-containing protein [Aequorivita sp. KMM 9714]